MAATRRKQDDRNLETLRELIAAGENRHCLDCGTRGPTYVNTTIGSFVCSKCSGMLRGLTPPHRVKSISMATFTPDEMELIRSRGNEYCRRIWLGLHEGESSGARDEQSIRDFMSDKYEKRRYYLEPDASARNGDVSRKCKLKPSAASNAPLISIAAPAPAQNGLSRPVGGAVPPVNATNFLPRPINNNVQTLNANLPAQTAPVPEFAVDFSTANIYNSSQYNNNNNYTTSRPLTTQNTSFNAFSSPAPPTNDRYAALADLDVALRQQKYLNNMEENVPISRNPFEASSADLFGNKNPFGNGAWGSEPASKHFNPFAPPTNSSGFTNSKNPFL